MPRKSPRAISTPPPTKSVSTGVDDTKTAMASLGIVPIPYGERARYDLTQQLHLIPLALLRRHPENYQTHPAEELAHLAASITRHGFYKNIVVARDFTILAGHGTAEAGQLAGQQQVPAVVFDLDPFDDDALAILVGDNEIQRGAVKDERRMTDILVRLQERQSAETETLHALAGTGFDPLQLRALVMVTRDAGEVLPKVETSLWSGQGMPDYGDVQEPIKLTISFRSRADRSAFCVEHLALKVAPDDPRTTCSTWWPPKPRDKTSKLLWEG